MPVELSAALAAAPARPLARVLGQRQVGAGLYELWFEDPAAARARAGQFVHLRCDQGFLRRPFSVYRTRGDVATVLYRVHGAGTRWLAGLAPDDALDVLGPLGHPFTPPAPGDRPLLVAGGVGVAPLALYAERHGAAADMVAIAGFRSAGQVVGLEPFEAGRVPVEVRTEDGTEGLPGRVTAGLAERLAAHAITRVLACGPEAMMREVAAIAAEHHLPCEVSMERPMGCGIGICLACVVPTQAAGATLRYERACLEGPVFDARKVVWS